MREQVNAHKPIDGTEDVLDSRDIIARISYLERAERDEEDEAEYKALLELQEDAWDYAPDWRLGCALIHDSYFEKYARELAEDLCGSVLREASWPLDHIDWSAAAEALQQDYTSVSFGDETYWVR